MKKSNKKHVKKNTNYKKGNDFMNTNDMEKRVLVAVSTDRVVEVARKFLNMLGEHFDLARARNAISQDIDRQCFEASESYDFGVVALELMTFLIKGNNYSRFSLKVLGGAPLSEATEAEAYLEFLFHLAMLAVTSPGVFMKNLEFVEKTAEKMNDNRVLKNCRIVRNAFLAVQN